MCGEEPGVKYNIKMRVAVIIVSIAVLSGCLNSKYRYEETMNSKILDFEEYQTAVDYYNAQNYEEAILYYELTLDRIKETMQPGTTMEYWIKGKIGESYLEIGQLDRAYPYVHEAREELEKKDDVEMLGTLYQLEGKYYKQSKQYETALLYYEKALEYVEDDELIGVYRLMADTYDDLNRKQKALEYYDYAIEIGEKRNDIGALVNVYYGKGIVWALEGELKGAKTCFEKGQKYAEYYWRIDDVKVAEGYTYLARVSVMEKDFETAYFYSRKAMDIYISQDISYNYERQISNMYNSMGYLNMESGNYNAALKMIKKAFDIAAKSMEENEEIKDLYEDYILDNIKSIYKEFIHDGTDYETWFKENFES